MEDAFAAIDNGGKLRKPDELPFDICFGGRRQFCNSDYSDLGETVKPQISNHTSMNYWALAKLQFWHGNLQAMMGWLFSDVFATIRHTNSNQIVHLILVRDGCWVEDTGDTT